MSNHNQPGILFINPAFCNRSDLAVAGIAYLREYLHDRGTTTMVINFNKILFQGNDHRIRAARNEYFNHIKDAHGSRGFNIGRYSPDNLSPLSDRIMRGYSYENYTGIINDLVKPCRVFDELFLGNLPARPPQYLGVSITYSSQLLFSLIFARFIKHRFNNTIKIIAGGPSVTYNINDLAILLRDNPLFDYMVVGRGQSALWEIIKGEKALSSIPNLIFYDNRGYKKSIAPECTDDSTELSTPFYEPNDTPCLQLLGANECYWSKCTFCTNYDASRIPSKINIDDTVNRTVYDIMNIQRQIKNKNVTYTFTTRAFPSPLLRAFSKEVIRNKYLPRNYWTYIRPGSGLDYRTLRLAKRAGFGQAPPASLAFGLETTSPRLQNLINKGIDVGNAKRIFEICSRLKLSITINFIYSLPTQTEQELIADIEYAVELIRTYFDHKFVCIQFSGFKLNDRSDMFRNDRKYKLALQSEHSPILSGSVIPHKQIDSNAITRTGAEKIINYYIRQLKDKSGQLHYTR